jgi:dihydropteroate synthase
MLRAECSMKQPQTFLKTWKIRNRDLSLETPKVMGILNITPDSFSDGGRFLKPEDAILQAEKFVEEGADILDIGAESTRPGARPIDIEDEWKRLEPVLKVLSSKIKIPISLDTRHTTIAERSIEAGVEIINDVSCASDPQLLKIVSVAKVGYILMHTRGEPANMMQQAVYKNVVEEVQNEISQALERVLKAGVDKDRICLDPGIGFAKNPEQSYNLLEKLDSFNALGYPLLVGVSRKRLIRQEVGEDEMSLKIGNVVAGLLALQRGAKILRVHDVAETRTALKVWQKIDCSQ